MKRKRKPRLPKLIVDERRIYQFGAPNGPREPFCTLTFGKHKVQFRPIATPRELWLMAQSKELNVQLTETFRETYHRSAPQGTRRPIKKKVGRPPKDKSKNRRTCAANGDTG